MNSAEREYKRMSSVSEATRPEAQAKFVESMSRLDEAEHDATSAALPEHEALQWQVSSELEDKGYQLEQVKKLEQAWKTSAAKGRPEDSAVLEDRIKRMEERYKKVEEALDQLKSPDFDEATRESLQLEIQKDFKKFDKAYTETVARTHELEKKNMP